MPGITLVQAEQRLADYMAAEEKVLSGQAYSIAGRSLTRANIKEIREGIDYWNAKVATLNAAAFGRGRARTMVPKG